ncbi:Cobyrinic acid a,c-diamide synthase [Bradyrhizobium sp. ORS 285]|uniref:ParA family protein n=1 Tax=Bradyrhizobium sp. ORS 285 TaxID=115808 RepID=UPI0002406814|nr:AAA family ATPase [Bradyrhizobium sp. ORS 285]CCD88415.1 Cobyrinic acid a,c-diamide synthase [Bradyrhizobium sp. ORS 285]SMX56834.1 Cobyrinic acid a,c-diamide synthase [Bradyrhizobium sp. ORS 285]
MNARVIAVANMKGGVGKTTTVVSLAEALAASGNRTLVIDLDPQANASICLAGDSLLATLIARKATIEGFLENNLLGDKKLAFNECIRNNVSNVTHLNQQLPISLLPSSPNLRHFEQRIIHDLTQRRMSWSEIVRGLSGVVNAQLLKQKKAFDFILIDCAPGISVLTEVSIRLADLVIVPTIADFLSTFGLQTFCAALSDRGLEGARRTPRKPHVLITRRRQVKIHAQTAELLRNEATATKPAFHVFETEIPEAVSIANALSQIDRFPSFTQKWGSALAPLLSDLVREIGDALDANRA